MISTKETLSKEQVRQYHQQGWLGPFTLISEVQMAEVRRRINQEILEPGRIAELHEKDYFHNRHLDNRCIYELLSHPNLVEKAARILGGHLVLWRTNFQLKPPLAEQDDWDTEIPWHQDCAYYQPSPNVILSAWIAVDEATRASGCMRVLPRSHKRLYPHIRRPRAERFGLFADPSTFDPNKAVDIELKPGQFVFFNESILHSSVANRSSSRRLGIPPRITVPFVEVGNRAEIEVLMLKGEDYMGDYRVVEPPKEPEL